MEPLCGVLYDVLRPLVVQLQDVDELCELVDILKHEVGEWGGELMGPRGSFDGYGLGDLASRVRGSWGYTWDRGEKYRSVTAFRAEGGPSTLFTFDPSPSPVVPAPQTNTRTTPPCRCWVSS